jgi:hypothetical protein
MLRSSPIRNGLGAIFAIILLGGCASTFKQREVDNKPVPIDRPTIEISESQLLGVRIHPFDPGEIPTEKDESLGLSKDIRDIEGYYSATQLKNTSQQSGYWGPVRVVPAAFSGGEVVVTGRILESDGEILKVAVNVRDATGSLWFAKVYENVVDAEAYDKSESGIEAFRYLYNRIANDMALHRQNLAQKEVETIRQVAELKFAEDLAPDAFKGYLLRGEPKKETFSFLEFVKLGTSEPTEKSQIFRVARLPANDDSMLKRIRRIRAREESLVDTFDLQYEELSRKIGESYAQWRISRLNEMNAVREREQKRDEKIGQAIALGVLGIAVGVLVGAAGGSNCYTCASAGGSIAGSATTIAFQMAVRAADEAEADTEIHKAALEELGQSLAADVEVTMVQVKGETIELKGTAEAKFREWRRILRQIYEREVGPVLPADQKIVMPNENGALQM